MTLLEAAEKKGLKIYENEDGDRWPAGCPFENGLETVEESMRRCLELNCGECYAREYKGPPSKELEEVQPEQPGEEPEEKRYVEGLLYVEEMEKVTITKAGAAAEICIAEHILLARLLNEVKNSGVEHAMAIQYLVGVAALAEMVMRRLEEC